MSDERGTFVLYIDPGTAPETVVADVLVALSNLHVAYGGHGLHFSAQPRAPGHSAIPVLVTPILPPSDE